MSGPRLATVLLGLLLAGVAHGADLVSYALVNDDATLTVRNRTVHLFGIHVPPSERFCRANLQPVRCAPRAALALEFKIQGFVHCEPVARYADRSLSARCRNDGVDLSEYLLSQGWAVARPEAPFEYHTLERIARHRGLGVWGMRVDRLVE